MSTSTGNTTDDTEKLREAFASLSETVQPTDDCPEPERLWNAARGGAAPGETRELIDHTSTCAACAEAWRLAVHLSEDAPAAERAGNRTWWRVAVAAAVVVGMLGLLRLADLPFGEPGWRDAGDNAVAAAVGEDVPLPRDAFILRWGLETPVEGTRYDVRVTTEDLRVLAEARGLEAPSFQVAATALAELPSGSRVFWLVEASLPDGKRLTSKTFLVRLE